MRIPHCVISATISVRLLKHLASCVVVVTHACIKRESVTKKETKDKCKRQKRQRTKSLIRVVEHINITFTIVIIYKHMTLLLLLSLYDIIIIIVTI